MWACGARWLKAAGELARVEPLDATGWDPAHLEHAEVVREAVALGGGRQHDLRAQHRRQGERRDVAVLLVDEACARGVPQQHPQPLVHPPLGTT